MRWAERVRNNVEESRFGAAVRQARAAGILLDLTVSNPTVCGLDMENLIGMEALANEGSRVYRADPLGSLRAREAVCKQYYGPLGLTVRPDHVLLTASTSEAYGFLLRLLCDPGDAVLVPQPGYPLLEMLGRMHDVEVLPYPLVYHDGWQVDAEGLRCAVTTRCRAILTVNPNNPTGHFASETDREALYAVAKEHGLAVIADEVFLNYAVEGGRKANSFLQTDAPAITFVMSGMSKVLALPQMKLAWTALCGPAEEVAGAMERLEVIADTFLSVSAPVQEALTVWLESAGAVQDRVRNRVLQNLRTLDQALGQQGIVSRLRVGAGWCAVLRVPALEDDTDEVIDLLESRRVLVHPGSFYGFPNRGWIVVSLLPEPAKFSAGVDEMLEWFTDQLRITGVTEAAGLLNQS